MISITRYKQCSTYMAAACSLSMTPLHGRSLATIFKNIYSVKDKMPHTVTYNRNTFAHILDLFLFSAQARMMFWKDQWVSRWLILLTCGRLRWANMANIANIANMANLANIANMKRESVNNFSGCCGQKNTAESICLNSVLKKNWKRANQADFLQTPQSFAFFHTTKIQQIWAMHFLDIWLMMMMK